MQTLPRGNVPFHCVVHPGQILQKRRSHFQKSISMGFIFSIKCCPCSTSSYTNVSTQQLYLFQEHKQIFKLYDCLWHKTRMQEQFPYTWDHHKHSLEHEMWSFWERRPSWEKKFSPSSRKILPLENLSLLHIDHYSECQRSGLAFKRNGSTHLMQSSRNAWLTVLESVYKQLISIEIYPYNYSTIFIPLNSLSFQNKDFYSIIMKSNN